jgi:RNA processing factor Prp31
VATEWRDFAVTAGNSTIGQHWDNCSTPEAREFVERVLSLRIYRTRVEEQLEKMMSRWVDALADPTNLYTAL